MRGVNRQRVEFFNAEFCGFFAFQRQTGDLHGQRFVEATCGRLVLHFALQIDEQTFEFGFAIGIDRELAPGALGVHQFGQRNFVSLRPALQLGKQHVGFLGNFVA